MEISFVGNKLFPNSQLEIQHFARRNSCHRLASAILCFALVAVFAGCNRGPRIAPVGGHVTMDGKPMNMAEVIFQPEAGRASHGYTDASGHYELRYTRDTMGALVGLHTVRILSATEITLPDGRYMIKSQIVPPKYNTQSELRAEVEDGDNQFNFDLTGAMKPK